MANSKRWCYTLNNYTQQEYDQLHIQTCVYHVIGKEKGASGTPHLQGFIIFKTMQRLSAVKKINGRAHWEPARGTSDQAADYCQKDGDYVEVGTRPQPPAKAGGDAEKERWKRARDASADGRFDEIPDDIYIKYYRTLKEIAKDNMKKPDDSSDVTGVWIYGAPGVGKSHYARLEFPDAYLKMQNKWWDGYQQEKYVILDDFDSRELGHHLKIWADRYSFLAETKGGAMHIRPEKFVITSNYSIEQLWEDPVLVEALKRRFKVIHMKDPFHLRR